MATYLDRIVAHHRERAAADTRSLDGLIADCADLPPARGFAAALATGSHLAVVAEVKRRSPSKGDLFADLDPAELAGTYEAGGASCLSVLTDVDHFGGSVADLQAARAAVSLPVIRKDFTVSALDVCDARLMGADAVLLIVAALSDDELAEFSALAARLGLDALVETHDEAEVERALAHTAGTLIGVNQRDLVTFEVDQERAVRVAQSIPAAAVKVAESGVRGPADAVALAAAGYDAVLVGEHLVTSGDPAGAIASLRVPRR
ncbi:MAG: indole-3-glycerol phosphate synthase TrpC [Acidimicrobiales bacterium]